MNDVRFVTEAKAINIPHDTYKRECIYTRGIHIPTNDFEGILDSMPYETRIYFDFHNPGKKIQPGVYLNGYNGLARTIIQYYKREKNIELRELNNGKDFYVKLI